jgi:hypothetical protein
MLGNEKIGLWERRQHEVRVAQRREAALRSLGEDERPALTSEEVRATVDKRVSG